jgi:hypothetical protein
VLDPEWFQDEPIGLQHRHRCPGVRCHVRPLHDARLSSRAAVDGQRRRRGLAKKSLLFRRKR